MKTTPLASAAAGLGEAYDIVIVGSGYGGAVSAARLGYANQRAGARLRIALLERGEEHLTGSFPDTQAGFLARLRHPELNPLGLFDIHGSPTMHVLQGSGLGGTSLINANVALEPDAEVFGRWSAAIREEVERGEFGRYYARAAAMLRPVPFADGAGLRKVPVLRAIGEAAGARFEALRVTVSREARTTRYGVERRPCNACGDCITGCNVGAKNTLATNYLPMARHHGVELYVRQEVEHLEPTGDGRWRLVVSDRSGHPLGLGAQRRELVSRRVILAAGTLGTAGILLRSAHSGLRLSRRLGHGFSGNGDFFAVAYNSDHYTAIQGTGERLMTGEAGPTIAAHLRLGATEPELRHRFTVQDLGSPQALVDFFRHGLMSLALFEGRSALSRPRRLWPWLRDALPGRHGALGHTLGFLIMGHDDAGGRLELRPDGSVAIDWPEAASDPIYAEINAVLGEACAAAGGTYIPYPLARSTALGKRLATAHPLGGAALADDPDRGVVDHRGRLYRDDGGVHDGLYVSDGSVIPGALGVNPFFTIAAVTERMVEHLRAELGLPGYDEAGERDDR